MRLRFLRIAVLVVSFYIVSNAEAGLRISKVAEGLYYPAGLARLADGGVLIAEAGGHGERSAGVSLLQPDGALGRLVSELPNGYAEGRLIGGPVVAVTPDGEGIVIGVGDGRFYNLPAAQAQLLPASPFTLKDLAPLAWGGSDQLLHASDLTFDEQGSFVAIAADGKGLLRDDEDGSLAIWHHFPALDNPEDSGGQLTALATGIVPARKSRPTSPFSATARTYPIAVSWSSSMTPGGRRRSSTV